MLFLPKNPFLIQNTLGTAINLSMALKHLENHFKNQNKKTTELRSVFSRTLKVKKHII
jgi:methylthioribose-1-phosphate isomerase